MQMLSCPGNALATSAFFALALSAATAEASGFADNSIYLRFGLGLSVFEETKFQDPDCNAKDPDALFGCGLGPDGFSYAGRGEFDEVPLIEAAFGMRFNQWLDAEFSMGYRPDLDFEGQSNFFGINLGEAPIYADGWNLTLMANVRLFLDSLRHFEDLPFRPFISGGIGAAVNHIGSVELQFQQFGDDRRFTPSGTHVDVAWSVGSGVEFALSDRLKLDLSYRFVDLGDVETSSGLLEFMKDGLPVVLDDPVDIEKIRAPLTAHEFLISLSYFY